MKKHFNLNIKNILLSIFSQFLFHVTASFLWLRNIFIFISHVVVIDIIASSGNHGLVLISLFRLAINISISNDPVFLLLLPLRLVTEHHRDGQLDNHVVIPGRGLNTKIKQKSNIFWE